MQKIVTPKGETLVVLPLDEYERLIDEIDIAAANRAKADLAAGRDELVPAEIVNRIVNGESPVRVWREYRGMTARDLAGKAEISPAYLSQIESGSRDGSFDTIKKIAAALDVTVDELA